MSHLHHSSTTPAKRAHYVSALSTALLSGSWSSSAPGKAPNNSTPLDWAELVRKWGKHTDDDGVEQSLIKGLREVSLAGLPMVGLGGAGAQGYDIVAGETRGGIPNSGSAAPRAGTGEDSAPSSSSSDQSNTTAISGISNSTSTSSFIHVPHPHLPAALHRKDKDRVASNPTRTGSSSSSRLQSSSTAGSSTTQRVASSPTPSSNLAMAMTETAATSVRGSSPVRASGSTTLLPSSTYLDGDDDLQVALLPAPACFSPPITTRSAGSVASIRTLAEHASSILAKRQKESTSASSGLAKLGHSSQSHGQDTYARAALLLGYAKAVLGDWEGAREALEGVQYPTGRRIESVAGGVLSGDAMSLDYGRGRCLLGMAYEITRKGDAMAAYLSAIHILGSISTLNVPSITSADPSSSSKAASRTSSTLPIASFESSREVHRWLSVALVRGTILSASGGDADVDTASRFLRTYHLVARSWPTGFKPKQRAFMLSLHSRALHAGYPSDSSSGSSQDAYLVPNIGKGSPQSRSDAWQRETIDSLRVRQAILTETTTFPRAGEVNSAVEGFVAECVELWERGGCGMLLGREVVQILWWSMSLTFHSQSILRYLTRLLQATGSSSDAKRTFELYVQLVLKARQTESPDQPLRLQKRSVGDETAGPSAVASSGPTPEFTEPPANTSKGKLNGDANEDFVEALLNGASLLSKDLDDPEDGWRYVDLAGDVLDQFPSKGTSELQARVEECKGIIRIAMAVADEDPLTRPVYQAQGLDHLAAATKLNPTSSMLMYHLAYARAEARDIDKAITAAHQALELDTENIEAWHLLALLLTAQRDWQGALKAVQAGIETWEQLEEELTKRGAILLEEQAVDPGVQPRDFALSGGNVTGSTTAGQGRPRNNTTPLLTSTGISPIPSNPSTHLASQPSPSRRLTRVIQLRMTQAVIVEKLEGPGAAMWRQQDTFSYFSARSGYSRPSGGGGGGGEGSGSVSGSVRDLGESYIAVPQSAGAVNMGETVVLYPMTAPSIIQPITQASTPRAGSPSTSVAGDPTGYETDPDATGSKSKSKRLHLHVPGSGRHGLSRTLSSASVAPSEVRNRTTSNASVTTTPAQSHYHGARPVPLPPPPSQTSKQATSGRTPAELRVLSNLWLQSAATFRRWGKLEQALGAIQEAEVVDPENAEVWLQLGLYWIASRQPDSALDAFTKGLILRPTWPPIVVSLARHYLTLSQPDLAHGLLNPLTQGSGWDVPEAWYWLSKTCEAQGGREERVRECLVYAWRLEKGRTCRPVGEVLERWL